MKRALVGLACVLVASIAQARAADPAIPPVLEPWQEWVLHDDAPLRCPARLGVRLDDGAATVCAWPGVLELDVAAAGARFRQRWQVYAEEWVPLAGSSDDWPVDVRVDGRPVAVLDRDGQPAVQLSPGDYEITGEIRWADRPASLAVPVAA
ncbi:MAG TPA: hypothetical protein VLT59_11435, partial [Steroidobacteraceae bacterium]|nr:hypothetical protein [Steroidobacteraceae bacterium]